MGKTVFFFYLQFLNIALGKCQIVSNSLNVSLFVDALDSFKNTHILSNQICGKYSSPNYFLFSHTSYKTGQKSYYMKIKLFT